MPQMDSPEWDAIRQLELPFVHGPGWDQKLKKICSEPGHEQICKNPMLLKSPRLPADFVMNPITFKEIAFFSQNYFAKQLQQPIAIDAYKAGMQSEKVPVQNINRIITFFVVGERDGLCPLKRI